MQHKTFTLRNGASSHTCNKWGRRLGFWTANATLRFCLAAVLGSLSSSPVSAQALDVNGVVHFPLTGCAWPYLTTPEDLNVFYPDTNAKYWTMPYTSLARGKLIIRGRFLPSRFLSINTYDRSGQSIGAIADRDFLALGGTNPFTQGGATTPKDLFQVTIVPMPKLSDGEKAPPLEPGEIYGVGPGLANAAEGYVVLRSYVDKTGGGIQQSDLPDITVELGTRETTVKPCTTLAPPLQLITITLLERLVAELVQNGGTTPPNKPALQATFVPPYAIAETSFPNDFNKYVGAVFTYKPGRIAVIRGKAATTPRFNNAGLPAVGLGEQMRYWSLCVNESTFPYPVIDCKRDDEVALDATRHYTFVVATSQDMPGNVAEDPTVTSLKWGSIVGGKALLFRNMLPTEGFGTTTQSANAYCTKVSPAQVLAACAQQQMQEYYPQAYYCEKRVYESGGWKACAAASGGAKAPSYE